MATHHPNGADSGGATTIASPIRDGVAGSSDSSGLPDWKRELIERRKNLAKTTTSPGHSHSQHSGSDSPKHSSSKPAAVQSRNAASPSGSCASAATPDSSRSHTATPTATTTNPVTGTTSPAFNVNVSLGSSFDRVTSTAGGSKQHLLLLSSPGALADVSKFRPSAAAAEGGSSRAATATTSPVSGNQSNGRSGQQQVKNENHHNNNCSVDNNKKRNTDDAESVRSSSASSIPSAAAAGGGVLAKSGRVVKKPDLQQAAAAFGRSGSRDSGQREEAKDRKSDKMVAQEVCDSSAMEAALTMISGNGQCGSDEAAEELKYGPGIVQKLRSRFMSYTMRLNAAKNQRPSLQNMRRATSLNNLLDDDVESTRTASPLHSQPDQTLLSVTGHRDEKDSEKELIRYRHSMGETNGFTDGDTIESQCCDGLKKYQNEMLRSRQLRRGNDSLKRARSVETLRYDSKAWERDVQMTANNEQLMQVLMHENPRDVNIEERIVKARERGDPRPTRLKPFMDDTERPPPDLVKTTLMKFEATANRRGRAPSTRNGEVAAKVASYKSILEKPAILYPKPPLSPKKPVIKPRTSLTGKGAPLPATAQQRSPSPLLIHVDMTYNKQSTPACPDRRNGPNLLASPPQTPPDLINSIGARKSAQQKHQNGGGYESPITQLTHKLKSMHLQSPATTVGGGPVAVAKAPVPSDNSAVSVGGGAAEVGGSSSSTSNSSASTATSSATSSPVPHSGSGSVTGSYYLNGGSSAGGRLELGDVSAEDCYEYRDYDDDQDHDEDEEAAVNGANRLGQVEEGEDENGEEFDDEDDDEVDKEQQAVRRINKVDLQNIGQAGTTQEFRFGNGPAATNKSHLPVVPPRTGSKAKQQQQDKMRFVSSGGGVVGGGVASVKAPEQLKKNGHGSVQEIVLGNEALQETNVDDCKTTTALLIKQIKEEARKTTATTTTTTGGRDNLNQVGVVNSSAVLGHKGGSLNSSGSGPNQNANSLNNSNLGSAGVRGNGNSDTRQALSNREIEKNLINVGKSVELKEQQQQQQLTTGVQPARKKSWQEEPQTNTMVFNFSQRKDVPDYIDSDGMILLPHRKRELPKPGESGFVVLGDLSLETSTDPDDSWTMGPPSPCNIEFENDNVIIEGKSNLRKQLNRSKWNIRFDDSLTSTFEYISESSYLEAYDDDVDSSSDSQLSSGGRSSSSNGGFFGDGQGAKFMTISSAPLGSYMPMKGSLANSFELGVTKSPSPGSSVSMSPSPTQSKEEDAAAATKGEGLANGNGTGAAGDPESLQYLKPATDPVAWSEGTRATDLLF